MVVYVINKNGKVKKIYMWLTSATLKGQRFYATLYKMGANIKVLEKIAIIYGGQQLKGATVKSTDLRGGMALLMAGLIAEGKTVIEDFEHVLRGYEDLVFKLHKLGAKVKLET